MITYLGRAAMAALLTVAIFLFMRYLINPQNPPIMEEGPNVDIKITRDEREEKSERDQRELPQQPEKAPPPPPPADHQERVTLDDSQSGYQYDWSAWDTKGAGQLPMDRDRRAMPIVRIPPRYPQRALSRGLQGRVLLEFTITPTGGVEDVRVISAEPPNVFERESIRALERWKYQPKIVDGQPVAQRGMQEVIVFQLEDRL